MKRNKEVKGSVDEEYSWLYTIEAGTSSKDE